MKIYLAITTYSFKEPDAHAFFSEEEAKEFLQEDFKEELRIQTEENGLDIDAEFTKDGKFAKIADPDQDMVMEWYIVESDLCANEGPVITEQKRWTNCRRIAALIDVDDSNAKEWDMGTCDYLEHEFGWLEDSGIRLVAERILDTDDPEDKEAIEAAHTIFD